MSATDITLASTVKPPSGAQNSPIGIAGEAFAAGMALYRKASDGKLYKAIATALESANVLGIALAAAAGADQVVPYFTGNGDLSNLSALVVGEMYFLSETTAGALMKYSDIGAGEYPCLVGQAKTATIFSVHIWTNGTVHA